MRVGLSFDVQEYIIANLVPSCREFVTALKLLRSANSEGSELSLANVKKIISPSRIDQFELAKLFSAKRKKEFFKRLIEVDITLKDWQQFFAFMQGHLIKLAGQDLIEKKSKLSQYDKQLLSCSKNWNVKEIAIDSKYFGKLQVMAKRNDSFLKEELRLAYISYL